MQTNVLNEAKPSIAAAVVSKLEQGTAKVGVIGMGYVGLPLAMLFARRGLSATGFDIDPSKVGKLQRGESYIRHIPSELIAGHVERNALRPTADFSLLQEMDAIVICVPTPLDDHREPDLTYIQKTAETVAVYLKPGQLVVLESTTYPGTTEEVVLPILEQSGLRCAIKPYRVETDLAQQISDGDGDFLLAFSPEREDPGNKNFATHEVPKVIGGLNASSALAARALYDRAFNRTVVVSSSRAAEMTKLLENIYRCVNIALVNELKLLSLRMGIDIWEVIQAAATKPFGFTPFYPGPGLGGHCIPIDPFYLTWKAREYEFATRFIELAGEVNSAMPAHVVTSVAEALNSRGRCLRGSRVLVLGVSYKKDIDDLRESPSLRIIHLLEQKGAQVDYNDPYFPSIPKTRDYDLQRSSVGLSPEALEAYDAVLVATDHSEYQFDLIVKHAKLVVDARNATRSVSQGREKIVLC